MKKLYYLSLLGLLVFEVSNVYFIMPMPGSQRMNSVALAYALYRWRWVIRVVLVLLTAVGAMKANWKRRWLPLLPWIIVIPAIYFINFKMSADHMFRQPGPLVFADAATNRTDTNRLVIGVYVNGTAKAYPIRFLGYHHLVQDKVGGQDVLVTYCTVCRTGRVYDPVVNGVAEQFRLVGMDHFNAMAEDGSTGSWWRQATGEAVAGKCKGQKLKEIFSVQASLGEWLRLHPNSLVMQEDVAYSGSYSSGFGYEDGTSRSPLTGTDTLSWKDKSWVAGIEVGGMTKAYDWNELKVRRIIDDRAGSRHVVLVLAGDGKSFFAFEVGDRSLVTLAGDRIICDGYSYKPDGAGIDTAASLKRIAAYQEFWHSWRTFHPQTEVYKPKG